MILFLDDNEERMKWFRSEVPSAGLAFSSSEMIELLQRSGPVDVLYLDHDLGGKEMISEGEGDTGMVVVRWIESHRPPIKKIVVHSSNYFGALRMEATLADAGYDVERMSFVQMRKIGIPYGN